MPSARSRLSSISSSLLQDVPEVFSLSREDDLDTSDDENNKTHATIDEHREPAQRSLARAVFARRSEYIRSKHVRIKVGTWNVAGFKGTEQDVGAWFVGGKGVAEKLTGLSLEDEAAEQDEREEAGAQERRYDKKLATIPKNDHAAVPGNADIDLYVLALQEIVDLGSAVEAFRPYADSSVVNKWKGAMAEALPEGYTLVAEQQLIGLLLLIYASPQVAPDVSSVSTTSVGTGLMNIMGNKGAVAARLVLGDAARLVFVNCHLAAGADKSSLERRNGDAQQIVSRTRFEPIPDVTDSSRTTGERIGDEDLAFWCGDLNYRMEGIPGDDVRRLLMLHTRHEYDLSQASARKIENEISKDTESVKRRTRQSSDTTDTSRDSTSARSSFDSKRSANSTQPSTLIDEITASEDPTSLQTTLDCLLPHDELQQQMKARKAFHDGWREGPITFLPTYKYDPGSVGVFDSSEKRRAPSWCDRILYRTRKDRLAYEAKAREEEASRKKDEEMKADGTDLAASDEDILYDYDPETDGVTAQYDEYDEDEDAQADDGEAVGAHENGEDELALEYYLAHQRVLSSDHKPLDAVFTFKYEVVEPELRSKVHAEVVKELDRAENEGRPNVTVVIDRHHDCPSEDFEGVWFGDIRWSQTKHRSLTVANTSRVAAKFSFIDRPLHKDQASGIAPQWLLLKINQAPQLSTVHNTESIMLEPGETCNVDLSVGITSTIDVQELNDGRLLDDILVLRVENGRDHFIPIKATWLASTLGRSIDKLIRIPEGGIRKMQRQQLEASRSSRNAQTPHAPPRKSTDSDGEEPIRCSAPRELFKLTEAIDDLSSRVIAEWEMTNPSPASLSSPRESLDSRTSAEVPLSPWHGSLAWPFDDRAWTERHTSQWDDISSDICNALDEDQPLESAMPDGMPKLQRLYALASFLLFFLKSMPGNVISTDLWASIEIYLLEVERGAKKHASLEDQRTALQEILASKSPNSITFVLITSVLERILLEIPSTSDAEARALSSPTQKNKRTSILSKHGAGRDIVRSRQSAESAMASVFAGVLIETPLYNGSEKARHAAERRKVQLMEIFLKREIQ